MFKSHHISYLVLAFLFACQPNQETESTDEKVNESFAYETTGSIDLVSPELENLIGSDAKIEILAEGFEWAEGPVWLPEQKAIIFSDIPRNTIFQWRAGEGKSVYVTPSGFTGESGRGGESGSNGLLLDQEGNLVLCQHGDRRMAKMTASLDTPKPEYITLAGEYDGKRFNSPNDATYHSNGALYFTDPPYGLEGQMNDPAKEIDFQGVYRLSTDGTVTLLTDELSRPNGIAFSPDEKTLYVANSDPERAIWMAYDVNEDGTIANGRVFFDATSMVGEENKGLPDGLKVDQTGNVFATGPGGVLVFNAKGEHLGTIRTGQATANCGFGDDGHSLYMTADMYLLRIKLKTKG